ncbi:hypothetical protein NL50_14875 [Clostridium acetobutylicum]|nr:hypothetical protein NL50_14875 [Clostridium acetobutylicum]
MIGDNIKKIREKKGISKQELADNAGYSFAYISMLENNKRPNPSIKTIDKIAKALRVSVEEVMNTTNEKSIDTIDKNINDSGINTIAAHYEHEEFTEDDKEDIDNFIKYILSKRKRK